MNMSKDRKHLVQPAAKKTKPAAEAELQAKSAGPHVEGDQTQAVMRKADPNLGAQMIQRMQQAGGNQAVVQAKKQAAAEADIQSTAAAGVAGSGSTMPHADAIQKSFGKHDVSHVEAHVGGKAADASRDIGASAYATGNKVAFANQPNLHTAAHEAAHVVQQQAGVSLKGGVGQVGDQYEQHADAVADLVVQGKSAEGELDKTTGGSNDSADVQHKAIQKQDIGSKNAKDKALPGAGKNANESTGNDKELRNQLYLDIINSKGSCGDLFLGGMADIKEELLAAAKATEEIGGFVLDLALPLVGSAVGKSVFGIADLLTKGGKCSDAVMQLSLAAIENADLIVSTATTTAKKVASSGLKPNIANEEAYLLSLRDGFVQGMDHLASSANLDTLSVPELIVVLGNLKAIVKEGSAVYGNAIKANLKRYEAQVTQIGMGRGVGTGAYPVVEKNFAAYVTVKGKYVKNKDGSRRMAMLGRQDKYSIKDHFHLGELGTVWKYWLDADMCAMAKQKMKGVVPTVERSDLKPTDSSGVVKEKEKKKPEPVKSHHGPRPGDRNWIRN